MKFAAALLFLCSTLFIPFCLKAQFADTIQYHLKADASGNINKTDAGVNYLLNSSALFGIRKEKLELNSNLRWLYGENAKVLVNNDFMATTDFNVYTKKDGALNFWGLIDYSSVFSLQVVSRLQTGAGAAYAFLKNEKFLLRLSDGLLFEQSKIRLPDTALETYSNLRNSLRLQMRFRLREKVIFESTSFWQPSLTEPNDEIWNATASLRLKIWKNFSVSTKAAYMNVTKTQRETFLVTYGLTYDTYF